MLSRKQIQFINSLQHKKYRKEHKCFVAEGSKLVEELLLSRLQFNMLFATQEWIEDRKKLIDAKGITPTVVTEKELSRISFLKTANQVVAVLKTPSPLFDPEITSREFILMLDGISDPGNLGTILRTADWFGIHHVVCSPDSVDFTSPKVVQATMGSIARVNLYYLKLNEVLETLSPEIPVYGSLLNGNPLHEINRNTNGVILIGNESQGISETLQSFIKYPVLIPAAVPQGDELRRPESLNAAVATAILCWELTKNSSQVQFL